jgi:hypothetical protein
MRCTIVDTTKVSAKPTFVARSPQNPAAHGGNVENIYQNISVKNAFRIIPPVICAGKSPCSTAQSTVLGRFRGWRYKYGTKNVFVRSMALMHIRLRNKYACCYFKGGNGDDIFPPYNPPSSDIAVVPLQARSNQVAVLVKREAIPRRPHNY